MLEFNVLTIFPEMFSGFTQTSICARAIAQKLIDINLYDFREDTQDKHRRVDDAPFGGGAGMLIAPQSVFDCFARIKGAASEKVRSINLYMSPAGKTLNAAQARDLSQFDTVNILCGHYEGVDQRILDALIDREISIGDYVLTGGELPAMVLMDAVMRYVPGVLGNDESASEESHSDGLLEYPQYTRPSDFRGMKVPDVLLSGHHAKIRAWQREQSILKTARIRPDLLEKANLSAVEKTWLNCEKTLN